MRVLIIIFACVSIACGAFAPLRLHKHKRGQDCFGVSCTASSTIDLTSGTIEARHDPFAFHTFVATLNVQQGVSVFNVTIPDNVSVVGFISTNNTVCSLSAQNASLVCTPVNTSAQATILFQTRRPPSTSFPITRQFVVSGSACTASQTFTLTGPAFCRDARLCAGATQYVGWQTFCIVQPQCCNNSATCVVANSNIVINSTQSFVTGNLILSSQGSIQFSDPSNITVVMTARSILIENGGALVAGSEAAPFGKNGGTLTIQLNGGISDSPIACTTADCQVPAQAWNGASANQPWNKTYPSSLFINPFNNVSDYFYQYMNFSYTVSGATVNDGMFGRNVIGVSYGGTLDLHGSWGTGGSSVSSWRRVAPVQANATSLTVDWDNATASTWPEGVPLRVVLTSTDWFITHNEELTVTRSGTTLNFVQKPQFPHLGDLVQVNKTQHPNLKRTSGDLRAAVGLLSRSITIRSVDAGATSGSLTGTFGGHVIVRQGFATCKVEGVAFEQLGQSGYKGRYPFHFHLARVAQGAYFRHNTVYDSNTRFVSIHGTHNTSVVGNVFLKSIGSGVYIEDGSEVNNNITDNLSVWVRAGFRNKGDYTSNPRNAFGIFCVYGVGPLPLLSALDCLAPAHYWIRNPRNDISRNLVVGAEATGVGYWFFGGNLDAPSSNMRWDSTTFLAYMQQSLQDQQRLVIYDNSSSLYTGPVTPRSGYPTVANFVNNSAFLVTFFINTVQDIGSVYLQKSNASTPLEVIFNTQITYSVAQIPGGGGGIDLAVGNVNPPLCTASYGTPSLTNVCSAPCGVSNNGQQQQQFCNVHVLEGFTGAFAVGTDVNFAAVWLRSYYFLLHDSWFSDVIGGAVNFVNAGDYSGVTIGYWGTCYGCVFYGDTQNSQSPYALSRGPTYTNASTFNSSSAICQVSQGVPPVMCTIQSEGIIYTFGDFEYIIYLKIYDGPMSVLNTAFINIRSENLTSCDNPTLNFRTPYCVTGTPRGDAGQCLLPAAALGWKSPNGFSYPPAYLLRGLSFENVDIRHYITIPEFLPHTFIDNTSATQQRYCSMPFLDPPSIWNASFTSIDRQTSFKEVDGTLSGYVNSIANTPTYVVNNDDFLRSPNDRVECRSLNSSIVSPFHFYNVLVAASGWQGSGSWRNSGVQINQMMQAWRLNYDPTTEPGAASDPPSMWLQGSKGNGITLAMEGTRYLIEIVPLNKNDPNYLNSLGVDGVLQLVSGCSWVFNTSGCCVPLPGSPGSCNATASGPVQGFDMTPPGQTYSFQFQYASPTMAPVEYVLWVGTGLTFDNTTNWLYLTQFQKSAGAPGTRQNIRGPANNQLVQDYQQVFPVPSFETGPYVANYNPPNKRALTWAQLQNSSLFPTLAPAIQGEPWWTQATLTSFFQPSYNATSGWLSVKLDFSALSAAFVAGDNERCGPNGFCIFNGAKCVCNRGAMDAFPTPGLQSACDDICANAGGVANPECPGGGCFGFAVTLPNTPYTPPALTNWASMPEVARPAPWNTTFASRKMTPDQAVC